MPDFIGPAHINTTKKQHLKMNTVRMIVAVLLWISIALDTAAAGSVFTSPTTNSVWYPGDKVVVTWDTNTFGPNDRIYIEVRSDQINSFGVPIGFSEYIHFQEANTGRKEWIVPDAKSDTTTYQLLIYNDSSYGPKYQSGFFQIRFGHKRPSGATALTVQQSVCLRWQATYGNLYEVQSSTDLENWVSEGYIVADREDFGATVLASGQNKTYRTVDWGPYSQ